MTVSFKLPEPSGSWPLLGHLSLLGSDALLHRVFGAMADCYGPAFSIQLGARQTLVISSWELVKECFTTNDRAFATRPRSLAVKLMGYDHAMLGFAPYGTYWRDMRKLAVVELLSNHRLEQLRPVWETEINLFLRDLYKLWVKNGHCPVQVEMKERIGDLTMNIGVWTIAGRRMCPGVSFALQVLHLALARLLHGFELGTLLDLKVDMTESPGLTMPKATPLEVVLTPRLPSTCY
ncbi:hypothetical protein CRG98_020822 [Punica granatum]|uniref:Uncharacterized protein n=1 Tax=Punica granatum TaxID=22663 RepID=A0A2I0JRC5_PUNGR|nr:hypothetical protein CRG98_020822 [Punica granatum]